MANRTVLITSEDDLTQTWKDSSCPNLEFCFNEINIDECVVVEGGYEATYDTLEVESGQQASFTYLCPIEERSKTYVLPEGEYGVKS